MIDNKFSFIKTRKQNIRICGSTQNWEYFFNRIKVIEKTLHSSATFTIPVNGRVDEVWV